MCGVITDNVFCDTVVTEPRVGDNQVYILPGRGGEDIGGLNVAAERALR